MRRDKRSFFERLTGAINVDDEYYEDDELLEDELPGRQPESREFARNARDPYETTPADHSTFGDFTNSEGQLSVDVLQTPEEIIIKSIVAGIKPEDLDVSITRDSVTLKGSREEESAAHHNDYFHRELTWGSFSRTIALPAEIDVEQAEAIEQHGLLVLRLPKIDNARQTKLQVRTGQ